MVLPLAVIRFCCKNLPGTPRARGNGYFCSLLRQKYLTSITALAYLKRRIVYSISYPQGSKYMKKISSLTSKRGLLLSFFPFLFLAIIIFLTDWQLQQQTQGNAHMKRPDYPVPSSTPSVTSNSNVSSCLPPKIKLTDIVSAELISFSASNGYTIKKVTVAQKLSELQASCAASGKLVDGTGREIYFYQLTGCWGNPPFNYQDILAKQRQELEQLRQHYTVIEMTCNPSGIPLA